MAGKKGRSGPPRNMNAARSGVTTWLKRRALPGNRQHVATMVTEYEAGLVTCKGGADAITEVERALVANAGLARGACLLILEEAATRGLVHQKDGAAWDLHPGLARLAQFLGAERQALVALGLERRERDALDPFRLEMLRQEHEAELANQADGEQTTQAEPPDGKEGSHEQQA